MENLWCYNQVVTYKINGNNKEDFIMDFINYNREAWNKEVENNNVWTQPVSEEDIRNAKKGEWDIVLTSFKSVPKDWFPL